MSDDAAHVDLAKPLIQGVIDALQWRGMPSEQIVEALVGLGIGLAADLYGHKRALEMTLNVLRLMARDLNEAEAEAAGVRPN